MSRSWAARRWRVGAVLVGVFVGMSGSLPAATVTPPSAEDEIPGATFRDRQPLEGRSGHILAENTASSYRGPEPPANVAPSLWWDWTAPEDGRFVFNTHGSEFDTVLTVFSGAKQASLVEVAANDDDGDVATSSVTVDADEGETYHVLVEAKDSTPGLVDLSWNEVEPPPTTEQRATGFEAHSFTDIPISINTGEKPQSKIWFHDGTWWSVLASTGVSPIGTWLWRLGDDGQWSNVLFLSSATDVRGDAKHDGDVTHILLHGPSSELISVEYAAEEQQYELWEERPSVTPISLPGSETATLDIDDSGRMWVVADGEQDVYTKYSDPPYLSFSSPIRLAQNIDADDITVVANLPGQVGVLWSNQTTRRFGFRTHKIGTSPTSWSSDEIPAHQSAQNVGGGMADDHLNVAVASDGTLYAAIKTAYGRTGYPVLGLLVRRPDGTWDPLYEVDRIGTRPIVLLNERDQTVRVVYTESSRSDNILSRTTSMHKISFDDRATVIPGRNNNVTSIKGNWSDRVLVMASSSGLARHAFLEAGPISEPVAVAGSVVTVRDEPVDGVLGVLGGSGSGLTFEIVDGPAAGSVEITDVAAGAFTYTPAGGVVGEDEFSFRVGEAGVWSASARVSVRVVSALGVRGSWSFDEGAGSVAGDGSGWGNDGVLRGSPDWVAGLAGSALRFDGGSEYVTVADDAAVDLSGSVTLAGWVRPERVGTQYVIKKAAAGSVDGYELSLASSGRVFVRFNQASSKNTYRVDSTSSYPSDGQTWMHVAATFDGATVRLFVDGVQEASGSGPSSVAVNDLALAFGAQPDGLNKLRGAVDEVRIYDRALTAQEIADLAFEALPE